MRDDFITRYLDYRQQTEPPVFFHRWAILSAVGAFLGRNVRFQLGEFDINPNMYVMLIGVPGTRKSTAIKLAKKLLVKTGYDYFSADKSSKEKFILDMAGDLGTDDEARDLIDLNLFGGENAGVDRVSEMYVACDEFNNFIGNGNIEFISLLGELWDCPEAYEYRIKNGKSIRIDNPTVSILGGNTATGFSLAFPAQAIGQGFFSRLLLVYSEPSGKKITFPERVDDAYTADMVSQLAEIKRVSTSGVLCVSPSAKSLLDKIYKADTRIDDIRFEHYANRRFTHLIKLCIVHSLSRFSLEISEEDVVLSNTVLSHTEKLMPKALGEFGEAKNARATHKLVSLLESSFKPLTMQEMWAALSTDMEKPQDLSTAISSLIYADKVIKVETGFLIKRKVMEAEVSDMIDYRFLSAEEAGPAGVHFSKLQQVI